jgi:hypothetical protein
MILSMETAAPMTSNALAGKMLDRDSLLDTHVHALLGK